MPRLAGLGRSDKSPMRQGVVQGIEVAALYFAMRRYMAQDSSARGASLQDMLIAGGLWAIYTKIIKSNKRMLEFQLI